MRRVSAIVVLFAFLLSCGGHWYALQVVAWANMVADFSEQVPLTTAVKMALSGEYPCKMCKTIAEEKSKEQSAPIKLPTLKKDFVITSDLVLAEPTFSLVHYPSVQFPSALRAEIPPTPPPQCV